MDQNTNQEMKTQYKEKINIIKNFISKNENLPKQGSKQWLVDKQFTIGGSEIAVITGQSAFSNIHSLVAQKVGITSFHGNSATRWGNLFEGVSEKTFTYLFLNEYKSHKIYATGSIPHWGVECHKYSPDGLCLLKFIDHNQKEYRITLLEFKSPYRSIPDHKVPRHYIPQVKAGLCTIEMAENAIFVNNMFKKCTLEQLDFSLSHDEIYHKSSKPYLKNIDQALGHGLILFSISKKNIEKFLEIRINQRINEKTNKIDEINYYKEFAQDISDYENDNLLEENEDKNIFDKIYNTIQKFKNRNNKEQSNTLIDLGKENEENFDAFLELYKPESEESIIEVRYLNPQININYMDNLIIPDELRYIKSKDHLKQRIKRRDYTDIIKKYIIKCLDSDFIPIGILPWKLFRSSNILVEKEQNYVLKYKDNINKLVDIIKKISAEPDLNSRARVFEEHFPDSDIIKEYYLTNVKEPEYYKEFVDILSDDDLL